MSEPAPPFHADGYQLLALRDGRALALRQFSAESADVLGPATAAIGPWAHYGFSGSKITANFTSRTEGVKRFQVECAGELAGAIIVVSPWLAGPYLQMLAILPPFQNHGVGARILAWFEAEARGQYEILAKKGEGLKRIVEACGGAQPAFQLMMLEHLQALAQTAATAISNIKFDKVIVWDSGNGANGAGPGGGAAGFLQSLAKSIPPMMNVMQDLGGVKMPEFLGKLTTEGGEAPAAKGEAVAAKGEATVTRKPT